MPTATYIALANITLTGSDGEVTFSSIPATYRDLVVVIEGTSSNSNMWGYRFNGDTGSNYSYVLMQNWAANGNNVESLSGTTTYALSGWQIDFGTRRTAAVTHIMDYSATDKHKTLLTRGVTAGQNVAAHANRWANTNAITSVSVITTVGTFNSGTTFALYGIVS